LCCAVLFSITSLHLGILVICSIYLDKHLNIVKKNKQGLVSTFDISNPKDKTIIFYAFLKCFIKAKKDRVRKTMTLVSYSVFLPERFFLRN